MMVKILALALVVSGCSVSPGNLQSKYSADLEVRKIRRIAVLPPALTTPGQKPKGPFASAPTTEAKGTDKETPEVVLTRSMYSSMISMPDWQIVSESEVREVGQSAATESDAARLKRIGEMVYADAVLTGRILRYRERIGDEWGAKSPASVAFVIDLVDVRRGDVIWSARFDETQKSLSENIFAIGEISQRGVRWLTAEQLTHEGVRKAVGQLHQMLVHKSAS
jgi:TolB-like protein